VHTLPWGPQLNFSSWSTGVSCGEHANRPVCFRLSGARHELSWTLFCKSRAAPWRRTSQASTGTARASNSRAQSCPELLRC